MYLDNLVAEQANKKKEEVSPVVEIKMRDQRGERGRPRGTTKVRKPIMTEEFNLLIKFLHESEDMSRKMQKKWMQVCTLLYFTGMRASELLLLRVEDLKSIVDDGEASLTNSTKTKQARLLSFSPKAIAAVKYVFEDILAGDHSEKELLFHAPRFPMKKMSAASFVRELNFLIRKILGILYSSHSFRSGLISELSHSKVSPKTIQTIIGHESISSTLRYISVSQVDCAAALAEVR